MHAVVLHLGGDEEVYVGDHQQEESKGDCRHVESLN